jgi:hypothetical protein
MIAESFSINALFISNNLWIYCSEALKSDRSSQSIYLYCRRTASLASCVIVALQHSLDVTTSKQKKLWRSTRGLTCCYGGTVQFSASSATELCRASGPRAKEDKNGRWEGRSPNALWVFMETTSGAQYVCTLHSFSSSLRHYCHCRCSDGPSLPSQIHNRSSPHNSALQPFPLGLSSPRKSVSWPM